MAQPLFVISCTPRAKRCLRVLGAAVTGSVNKALILNSLFKTVGYEGGGGLPPPGHTAQSGETQLPGAQGEASPVGIPCTPIPGGA
jgi:hypothetical protein